MSVKKNTMTKRILSILLMVCMMVTLMPTIPAYAYTTLMNHTFNMTMPVPVAGQEPVTDLNCITVDSEKVKFNDFGKIKWYKGDVWEGLIPIAQVWGIVGEKMEENETFKAGDTYTAVFEIYTRSGYLFDVDGDTIKFTVNGESILPKRFSPPSGIEVTGEYEEFSAQLIKTFTVGTPKDHNVTINTIMRDESGKWVNGTSNVHNKRQGEVVELDIDIPGGYVFPEFIDKLSTEDAPNTATNVHVNGTKESDSKFSCKFRMPGKDVNVTIKLNKLIKDTDINISVKNLHYDVRSCDVKIDIDSDLLIKDDAKSFIGMGDRLTKAYLNQTRILRKRMPPYFFLNLKLLAKDGYCFDLKNQTYNFYVNGIKAILNNQSQNDVDIEALFALDRVFLERVEIVRPETMYVGTEYELSAENRIVMPGMVFEYNWYEVKTNPSTYLPVLKNLGNSERIKYTPKDTTERKICLNVKAKTAALDDADNENIVTEITREFKITPIDGNPKIVTQPASLTEILENTDISFTAKATKATSATWYGVYPSGGTYEVKANPKVGTSTSFDPATGEATLNLKATRWGLGNKYFVVFDSGVGIARSDFATYSFNFVPVTDIKGVAVTTIIPVGGYLYLPEEASPATATNKDITWKVISGNEDGYVDFYGQSLRGKKTGGPVTVRATVDGANSDGTAFTKEYKVTVKPAITLEGLLNSYTSEPGKGQKIEWTLTKDENSPLTYYTHLYKSDGSGGWKRVATNLKNPYTVPFDAAESGKTCKYKLSAKASSGDFEVVEKEFEITWTAPNGSFTKQPEGGVGIRGTEYPDEQGFDVTFAVTSAVKEIAVIDKYGHSVSFFNERPFPENIPEGEEKTIRINSKWADLYGVAEETFYIEATLSSDGSTKIQSLPFVVKWANGTDQWLITVKTVDGKSASDEAVVRDGLLYELPERLNFLVPPERAIFAGWRVNEELKFDTNTSEYIPYVPGERVPIIEDTTLTPAWQYDIADITVKGLNVPVKGTMPDTEATVESVSGGNQLEIYSITWVDLDDGLFNKDKPFVEGHTYYATIGVKVIEPSGFLCDKTNEYIGTTDVENHDIDKVNGTGAWGKPISSVLIYTSPVTVTADVPAMFTVTYNANGHGTAPSKEENVIVGSKISAPTAPTAEGYEFIGWYKDSSCTMPWNFATDEVYKNITLYAKWKSESSSSGDSGGGSGGGSPSTGGGGAGGATEAAPETVTKPDGTTVTTEKKADGTEVITEKKPDGTETVTEKKTDGSEKSTEKKPDGTETVIEKVPDGATKTTETAKDGTKVVTDTDKDGKTTAEVTLPDGKDKADVAIPAPLGDKDGTVTVKVTDKKTGEVKEVKSDYSGGKVSVSVEDDSIIEILDDFVPLAGKMPFVDVKEGDWFYKNVEYVYFNNLMVGTSDTTFSPNAPTTRGMIVTILHRLEGTPAPAGANTFKDVENGKWYTDAVTWAKENGIVSGYSENSFGPNDQITREQMGAIMYNYAKFKGSDVAVNGDLSKFGDASSVSGWAKEAMVWSVENGILNGMGDNTLSPSSNATRAQVAAIMDRYLNK